MKNFIRIPRFFIPEQYFAKWVAPACDLHAFDHNYWDHVYAARGGFSTALSCYVPDVYLGENEEERCERAAESIYEYLENPVIERLNRGFLLIKRSTSYGMRTGILGAIDLEEYSPEAEKRTGIRASEETEKNILETRVKAREHAILEFSHTVLLYRDKKGKVLSMLEGEELERVYELTLENGARLTGDYIPLSLSCEMAGEILERADPCFLVADGNHTLAAAKKVWEKLKKKLPTRALANHPARFAMAEFVDYSDSVVRFESVPRLITEIDAEKFCSYFAETVKSKQEGNVLYSREEGVEGFQKAERAILDYVEQNGGRVRRIPGIEYAPGKDRALVVLPSVEKEDLLAAAKAGKKFPCKSFTLGAEDDARMSFEGKEISYD